MKKRVILASAVALAVLVIFLGYKSFIISIYNVKEFQKQEVNIESPLTILNKKLDSNEYFVVGNVAIKNDFDEFELFDENLNEKLKSYVLYDENHRAKAAIKFFEYVTYTRGFSESIDIFGNTKVTEKDLNDFMKNHDFESDFELLSYLANMEEENINIFTRVSKIKDHYIANFLANMVLVAGSYRELQGDYSGYVLKTNDTVEVNIIVGEKKYIISFIRLDYFTDSYIDELISTIKIQ